MLIKIVDAKDDQLFINENDIVLVKRGSYKDTTHCWRVETNGDVVWFLPCDKNEPFKIWLSQQIGGDAWQRDRERRKNNRQRMSGMLLDAALEATDATLEAIEKVEQCQISIT